MPEYFNNASGFVINGPTFIEGMSELQYLYKHVARGASHDSKDQYDKPKCHPDTRKQILSDIHEWIQVPEKETGITFLHGPAGAGKSCIARSVCEQAAKEGLLGASFFFWRGSPSRNNESLLITTLAYQLAETNVELKEHILSEVAKNPRIVDRPLEVQFQKLILEPCSMVSHKRLSIQAIVIDGLDECMGEGTQVGILQMLSRAVRFEGFPLAFFITSRPELHIQEALDSKEVIFATKVISLNLIPGAAQDIRTVLESGFIRILNNARFKKLMKSVPRPWPKPESIEKLVHRSSGQFIYSSTVLKFISELNRNPATQLDIVLGVQDAETTSPLANLDLLYHEIMSRVENPKLTLKVLSYVMAITSLGRKKKFDELKFSPAIIQAVLHNQNRLFLVVEQLLGISDGMAYFALNQLHSLISLKVGSESTRRRLKVDFYHKSFQDFLTTEIRSSTMYVNIEKTHYEICQSCLEFMGHPRYETDAEHAGWLYSCFQWNVHGGLGGKDMKRYVSGHDATLQRFIFKPSSTYLNVLNLNRAMQALGLIDDPGLHEISDGAFSNLKNNGSLSLEDLLNTVVNRCKLLSRQGNISIYCKLYAYPVMQKWLQSYNNAPHIKLLLLASHLTNTAKYYDIISEGEICDLLTKLGLFSGELEWVSVLQQYEDIKRRVEKFDYHLNLDTFLMSPEYSKDFHCTQEVISNVYTAIISTGIWRNHMNDISFHWWGRAKITATGPLLTCLKSEALECHDNSELNGKLTRVIERAFLIWLRKTLRGPTEDVIEAWERTFDRARSLFPNKLQDLYGKTISRN